MARDARVSSWSESLSGGACAEITPYPNIMIAAYGSISGRSAMQREIYKNGPIACGIDAEPLLDYTTGVAAGRGTMTWGVQNTEAEAHERELGSGAKARFADVGTGMRMRYREYGGDDRVVGVALVQLRREGLGELRGGAAEHSQGDDEASHGGRASRKL